MLFPVIPLESLRGAAEAARLVVLHSRLARPPGTLRYVKDGLLQFWQTPDQTDQRGAGNCVDLAIRWAAWLGRSRPIWLCFARTGARTVHVYLRADELTVIDPSIPSGMPPLRDGYPTQQEVKVLIRPEDFVDQEAEDAEGHGCACPVGSPCACPAPQVYTEGADEEDSEDEDAEPEVLRVATRDEQDFFEPDAVLVEGSGNGEGDFSEDDEWSDEDDELDELAQIEEGLLEEEDEEFDELAAAGGGEEDDYYA